MNIFRFFSYVSIIVYSFPAFSDMPFVVEKFQWGETEIISLEKEKINKTSLLEGSPLQIYFEKKATQQNIVESFEWCEESLKSIFPLYEINCALEVSHKHKKVHFVIGLKKERNTYSPERPKRSSILLNYQLISLKDDFNKKIMQLWGSNQDLTKIPEKNDYDSYYAGFSDLLLNKEVKELVKMLSPYKKHLLDVIDRGIDEEDRLCAIQLLNWTNITKQDIAFLIKQLPYQSIAARGKIVGVLNFFYFLIDGSEIEVLKYLPSLVKNIDYENRTNSLSLIYNLLQRNPSLDKKIDLHTREFIQYLAVHSVLPDEQDFSKKITLFLSER